MFTAISRIMNKLLIIKHREDRIIQLILLQKLIVIVERNCETVRDDDARQPGVHYFAEVGGFAAKSNCRSRSLLCKTKQTHFRQVVTRLHDIKTLGQTSLVLAQLIEIGSFDGIVIPPGFERYPPTVVLFQQLSRGLYVGVRNAPTF